MKDGRWLAHLCASRMSFGFIFMAYGAAMPLLMVDWRMTANQAGLVMSGWHLGYLLSLVIAGQLTGRWGAKRTLLTMSWAACTSAWLFALFADSFTSALLLYTLAGLCSGGSYTPGLALIAERIASGRRATAMGWFLAASSMGYAASLFIGGIFMSAFGWRGAFVVGAIGPTLGLILAYQLLAQTPNLLYHKPTGSVWQSWRAVIRNKAAMASIWSYALHSWELLALWAWLPAFLAAVATAQHGVEGAAAIGAALTGLSFLVNAVGSVAGGRLADRYGRVRVMRWLSTASIGCSLVFGWLFSAPLWLVTVVALIYNLAALSDSSVYSTALSELVPAQDLGTAYALRSILGFGLGAVSPAVIGLTVDLVRTASGAEPLAWGMAWTILGLGALPGLLALRRLNRLTKPGY